MIIEDNGIKIDASTNGSTLTFTVLEQSVSASKALRYLAIVSDQESGYTLKSNKHPNFNVGKKRFYIRGEDSAKNKIQVQGKLSSAAEATRALEALQRLIKNVKLPEPDNDPDKVIIGNAQMHKGSTTHVRFAFLDREMASKIQVTAHDLYPDKVIDWEPCKALQIGNPHWDEHIGQIVDVLNKSVSNKSVGPVNNPHRVTPQQARYATEAVRKLFKDADKNDALVAVWRVITGLRASDV